MADLRTAARLDETAVLMETFPGVPMWVAWRRASYLLWLRWTNQQGKVDLEGQERDPPPAATPFAWLRRP